MKYDLKLLLMNHLRLKSPYCSNALICLSHVSLGGVAAADFTLEMEIPWSLERLL
jgi:hypothetical protein